MNESKYLQAVTHHAHAYTRLNMRVQHRQKNHVHVCASRGLQTSFLPAERASSCTCTSCTIPLIKHTIGSCAAASASFCTSPRWCWASRDTAQTISGMHGTSPSPSSASTWPASLTCHSTLNHCMHTTYSRVTCACKHSYKNARVSVRVRVCVIHDMLSRTHSHALNLSVTSSHAGSPASAAAPTQRKFPSSEHPCLPSQAF